MVLAVNSGESETKRGEPETKRAVLWSREANWFTPHVYVRSEVIRMPATEKKADNRARIFIFRCTETGAERRWGCESLTDEAS